ncbi:MAG: hypothetical protein HY549_13340 [Elusimicrobia bacterium]|nr:hypothetical protein [Elusimicrobiota bacterium]
MIAKISLFMILGAPVVASDMQADQAGHFCGFSYRFESYGFGVAEGYTGEKLPAPLLDPGCFQIGRRDGVELKKRYGSSEACAEAFKAGQSQGIAGEELLIGSPSDCSHFGYRFGRSFLTAYARQGAEEKVGASCVEAYRLGRAHGLADRAMTPPSGRKESVCYMAAHSEAKLLPD